MRWWGSRTSSAQRPSRLAPNFAGAGLGSANISPCSSIRRSLISLAAARLPCSEAFCSRAQRAGATFEVTEMHPTPPCALKPTAFGSSPDSCTKSAPAAIRCCETRSILPLASLMPTTLAIFASRPIVSGRMSATVRPGTL